MIYKPAFEIGDLTKAWQGLSPETRTSVVGGLGGAALGGLAGGGRGALIGGLGGAGLGYGYGKFAPGALGKLNRSGTNPLTTGMATPDWLFANQSGGNLAKAQQMGQYGLGQGEKLMGQVKEWANSPVPHQPWDSNVMNNVNKLPNADVINHALRNHKIYGGDLYEQGYKSPPPLTEADLPVNYAFGKGKPRGIHVPVDRAKAIADYNAMRTAWQEQEKRQ